MYVIDANIFIQSHKDHYPMDVAPGYWAKIRHLAQQGSIISIDKVKNEIFVHQDPLKIWCEGNFAAGFFSNTAAVAHEYGLVSAWAVANRNRFNPGAVQEFLHADEADAWVIAYALANNMQGVVVTYEKSAPGRKYKIMIPDVCREFNIPCINPITMFRELRETF